MSLARLKVAIAGIEEVVSSLDLALVSCEDAAALVEVFIRAERLCNAGRTLAAARAAEGLVHRRAGYKDASSWLADKSGEPVGKTRGELETASRLTKLEETGRAFRSGELSGLQARDIAEAAASDPGAEKDLLSKARSGSLRELRDECERVKAAASSKKESEARYEAIRRGRYLRIWSGQDGATKGQFSLTPDAGARLLASLQPWADRLFENGRLNNKKEPGEAYMADALVEALTGAPPRAGGAEEEHPAGTATGPGWTRQPPPASVICRVDLSALRREETHPGEICEIPGVGPVPVSVARELLTDCFLKLVITEAKDVRSVVHYGRTLTAHQKTALQYRDPYCVVPGCGRSFGLENDHIKDFALGGPTSLDNLCRLCREHHALKTHHGYKIRGRPGAWEWLAPGEDGDTGERDTGADRGTAGRADEKPAPAPSSPPGGSKEDAVLFALPAG